MPSRAANTLATSWRRLDKVSHGTAGLITGCKVRARRWFAPTPAPPRTPPFYRRCNMEVLSTPAIVEIRAFRKTLIPLLARDLWHTQILTPWPGPEFGGAMFDAVAASAAYPKSILSANPLNKREADGGSGIPCGRSVFYGTDPAAVAELDRIANLAFKLGSLLPAGVPKNLPYPCGGFNIPMRAHSGASDFGRFSTPRAASSPTPPPTELPSCRQLAPWKIGRQGLWCRCAATGAGLSNVSAPTSTKWASGSSEAHVACGGSRSTSSMRRTTPSA